MDLVETVRIEKGRDLDFSNLEDRISIGEALLGYVNSGGKLDLYRYESKKGDRK